jgi:hypothetical protein
MASFEEARACPKCAVSGEVNGARNIPRSRDRLMTIWCRNARCQWYNTSWVVQQRPDGSVPDPDPRGHIKDYPKTTPSGLIVGNMQQLEDLLEAQRREGGAEI